MKKIRLKPSFEFIFSLSIISVLALPPLVVGQTHRDLDISINNGDTVINGKNIKDLSMQDRKQALKDIHHLNNGVSISDADANSDLNGKVIVTKKRNGDRVAADTVIIMNNRVMVDNLPFRAEKGVRRGDSTATVFGYRSKRGYKRDSMFTFNYRLDNPRSEMPMHGRRFDQNDLLEFHGSNIWRRRNSQEFRFTNTGSDGLTTQINFLVSNATEGQYAGSEGSAKHELVLNDLTLTPEFSEGKILIMFNLPSAAMAEIKFTSDEGTVLWSTKVAGGSVKKSFAMGLNGIYYLEVKQGGKVAVRRIVKAE